MDGDELRAVLRAFEDAGVDCVLIDRQDAAALRERFDLPEDG